MANFMKMMKQAANLQQDMQRVQGELAGRTVEFSSGGGMVKAVARGDMSLESIKIDPQVVNPNDVEMLEDLVRAAVDGALQASRQMVGEEMAKLTAGMGLPAGIKLPF